MHILPFSQELAPDWDALVRSSPDGFAWALSSWRTVILGVEPWALEDHSFALADGSRLLGVMPLQYSPHTLLMASSGWGSCGPVAAAGLGLKQRKKVLTAMFEHAEQSARACGAEALSFAVPPVTQTSLKAPWGVNPWLEYGFEDRSGITRILDLSLDEGMLWKQLSETARHAVNKARQAGYTVERGDWLAEVDAYYAMHVETYTRTGVPPHPKAYFANIAAYAAPHDHAVLWVCRDAEGHAVAFHNSAVFGQAGFYNTGCSLGTALEHGVNYLLFWEAMLGVQRMGVRWYECGDVFPGRKAAQAVHDKAFGLTVFKSKFGGEDHPSFRCFKPLLPADNGQGAQPETILSKKEAVRMVMRSGKQLVAAFAGQGTADACAAAIKTVWRTGKQAWQASCGGGRRLLKSRYARVPFIRPYWFAEEHAVGEQSSKPWTEADEAALHASLREQLHLEPDSTLITTGSGRTAIAHCLKVLSGLHPQRSKVILPSYGCTGTLTPIVDQKLTPVFVDSNPSLGINQEQVLTLLDDTVLACLVPHLCGRAVPDAGISAACREAGVYLIEDMCQAPGLAASGYAPHFRVFSFCFGKSLCATSGGLLEVLCQKEAFAQEDALAPHPERAAHARYAAFQAKCAPGLFWGDTELQGDMDLLTFQYTMTGMADFDKKILALQLQRCSEIVAKRKSNASVLFNTLLGYEHVARALPLDNNVQTKFTLIFHSEQLRNSFDAFMDDHNIETEGMYIPLHQRTHEGVRGNLDYIESMHRCVVNIPVRPNLTDVELEHIRRSLQIFLRIAGGMPQQTGSNKEKYSNKTYDPKTITVLPPSSPGDTYAGNQLWERTQTLLRYKGSGPLLDLCCGNGKFLLGLPHDGLKIGADYSEQFLRYGMQELGAREHGLDLVRIDAGSLPFADGCLGTIYSFSSLYYIDHLDRVVRECYRTLRPGGCAVFDFGNKYSINVFCLRYHKNIAQSSAESMSRHLEQCREAGFDIVEHRSFQLLPLWCDKPRWLWPLLHPGWTDIMSRRIKGKMLDEWVSSLPILRHFAFRHLVVCRKPEADNARP